MSQNKFCGNTDYNKFVKTRQETSLFQERSVQLFVKDRCKFTLATDMNNSMMSSNFKDRKPNV